MVKATPFELPSIFDSSRVMKVMLSMHYLAAPNGFFGAPRKLAESTEKLVQGTAEQSQRRLVQKKDHGIPRFNAQASDTLSKRKSVLCFYDSSKRHPRDVIVVCSHFKMQNRGHR